MNFWKKYKAKKELKKKLNKARFINFYGYEIDLSLGRIEFIQPYNKITTVINDVVDDYEIRDYFIIIGYDNFKEIVLPYNERESRRDDHICQLKDFIKSAKYTQYLNNYENLKKEYEQISKKLL